MVIVPVLEEAAPDCTLTAAEFVQLKQYKVVADVKSLLGKVIVPPDAPTAVVAVPIPGHATTAVIGATAVGQPVLVVLTVQLPAVVLVV